MEVVDPPSGINNASAGIVAQHPFEIIAYPSHMDGFTDQFGNIEDDRPALDAPVIPTNGNSCCDVVGHPPLSLLAVLVRPTYATAELGARFRHEIRPANDYSILAMALVSSNNRFRAPGSVIL